PERYRRGQSRLRAVSAVQSRLECEGLLPAGARRGVFDLATHTSLADFERKNDIFGWGFVAGETREALLRPPMELHLETFRRILSARVADAVGIVEDGSASKREPATYVDEGGAVRPVPNLIGEFADAALRAMSIARPEDVARFLRDHRGEFATLRVAFRPPPLPAYYAPVMDLAVEIDRGDVWYDFPFDADGRRVAQRRDRYPSFTLFVRWREQKIPLVRWRTTIGSWRSELHADGRVYLKYKNSDVGARVWKNIVAAPVWVPPAATPGRDLVTRRVFDPRQGPVTVVNTEVMGPGFASAYGLGMAIHLKPLREGGLFDNLIRTHGSVDYTSIARRFSHGCHRLVNNRAVRLFGFVLKHRRFERLGSRSLKGFRRTFEHEGRRYGYEFATRGYYYDLVPPLPVIVHPGRIRGTVVTPIEEYVRKPGVDYGPALPESPVDLVPVLGP
ncbi:MAG: L,D-transpeptidase, partial [Candidatus Binatia bacterium]